MLITCNDRAYHKYRRKLPVPQQWSLEDMSYIYKNHRPVVTVNMIEKAIEKVSKKTQPSWIDILKRKVVQTMRQFNGRT